jgi:signal transduction histidine kinase
VGRLGWLLDEPAIIKAGKETAPDAVRRAASVGWGVVGIACLVGIGTLFQAGFGVVNAVLVVVAIVPFVLDASDVFLPRVVAALVVVGPGIGLALRSPLPNSASALFFLVLIAGHTAALGSLADAALVLVGEEAWILYEHATALPHYGTGWIGWSVGCVLAAGMGWALHRELALFLDLHRAQAALGEQAVQDERRRIAREVHDVIAHSLTVTMLHLTGARLTLEHDPAATAEAIAALAEAERAGRQSLNEIRRTVGLLANEPSSEAPLPGARDIETLVSDFRAAGLDVSLVVQGDPAPTSASAGLALFRIVQESLTNAAKHAPGAPVQITAAFGPEIVLEVSNPLTRAATAGEPGGMGIPGMTERAQILGGSLSAGRAERGWVVTATFPRMLEPA